MVSCQYSQEESPSADGHSNRSIGGKKPKLLAEDNKASATNPESSGYVAKRHEFDPEYDNDADLLLADMEFKDNDSETDHDLKVRILRIYLARYDVYTILLHKSVVSLCSILEIIPDKICLG